jgi:hypothetical protein
MAIKKWLPMPLAVILVALLLLGVYLLLFPSHATVSNLKESNSAISLPTPIPANGTRQVTFSSQGGDYLTFNLIPETGFPPMPLSIVGGTITLSVCFGSQVLYNNTAQTVEGTVNLPQTGTYTLQVVNNNDFEVEFLPAPNVDASSLNLHHPYTEYSQVTNTTMQSTGFLLITGSIIAGGATLLALAVRREA